MTINRVFIGFDHRQAISYQVLSLSLFTRTRAPVSITPLCLPQLPIDRFGLTPFTYSRFLVPWLCGFKGAALFLDADMLVQGDIAELFAKATEMDAEWAVKVVKNPRVFEWPSLMLFNCGHPANAALTPEYVNDRNNKLFDWGWLEGGAKSELIGDLPAEWNHLAGYDEPRADAKLVHYTMGVPAFPETEPSEYAAQWQQALQACNSTVPWVQLMGQSVHATHLPDGRVLPHFHPDVKAWQQKMAAQQAPG